MEGQVAVAELGVAGRRMAVDVDAAVEHAAALAGADAVKFLVAAGVALAVLDDELLVEVLAVLDEIGAGQLRRGPAAVQGHVGLQAAAPAAGRALGQPVRGVPLQVDVQQGIVADVGFQRRAVVLDARAGGQVDVGDLSQEIPGAQVLDQGGRGVGMHENHDGHHAGFRVADLQRRIRLRRDFHQPAAAGPQQRQVGEGVPLRRDGVLDGAAELVLPLRGQRVEGGHGDPGLVRAGQLDGGCAGLGFGEAFEERHQRGVLPGLPGHHAGQGVGGPLAQRRVVEPAPGRVGGADHVRDGGQPGSVHEASHAYPCSSSLSASVRSPDSTMRPPVSTCTKSGTMWSSRRW